ncbi:hypothetical protein KIN20_016535 [Parelaphostrongylus tenuis]|uniref:Uncharacterized protein n=1 Tax=Parelaphostrongylus tenuis TaxID=148309 RepID=A0AAD5MYN6_PARTN|nr:hypothetical protein KIN20_016535 [Parelaphostrongylus tenuis]
MLLQISVSLRKEVRYRCGITGCHSTEWSRISPTVQGHTGRLLIGQTVVDSSLFFTVQFV